MRRVNRNLLWVLVLATALLSTATATAQDTPDGFDDTETSGVIVRVEGNVVVPPDETMDVVVVVDGNAMIEGIARVVVVVNGIANLDGARTETLTVVNGQADLRGDTIVTGDIWLADSTISQTEGVLITGDIHEDIDLAFTSGWFSFTLGLAFYLGFALLVILAGLLAAAVAGRQLQQAGMALTHEVGKSILSAIILWIALPLLAVIAFLTVIGIPTGLVIFALLVPMLWFLGYLVAGAGLGNLLLRQRARPDSENQNPYLAVIIGLIILLALNLVPVLGVIVLFLAGVLGAGALALLAWRAARGDTRSGTGRPALE